jgi:hypothetical protein
MVNQFAAGVIHQPVKGPDVLQNVIGVSAKFTKIGKIVTVSGEINNIDTQGSGFISILYIDLSLPFPAITTAEDERVGSLHTFNKEGRSIIWDCFASSNEKNIINCGGENIGSPGGIGAFQFMYETN